MARSPNAVRERLKFSTGDAYSTTAVIDTQAAVDGIGRFSTVRVEPDQDPTRRP